MINTTPELSLVQKLKKNGKLIVGVIALLVILAGTMIAYAYSAGLLGSLDTRQQASEQCEEDTSCGTATCAIYQKRLCNGGKLGPCTTHYQCQVGLGQDCAEGGTSRCREGVCDPSSRRCTDGGVGGTTGVFIQDNPSAADFGNNNNSTTINTGSGTSAGTGGGGAATYTEAATEVRNACNSGGGARACVSPNAFALCTSAGYTEVSCPHGCSNGQCTCEGGYTHGAFLCRVNSRYQCLDGSDVPVDANGNYAPGNNTCAYGCNAASGACNPAPAPVVTAVDCWVISNNTCVNPVKMSSTACTGAGGYLDKTVCQKNLSDGAGGTTSGGNSTTTQDQAALSCSSPEGSLAIKETKYSDCVLGKRTKYSCSLVDSSPKLTTANENCTVASTTTTTASDTRCGDFKCAESEKNTCVVDCGGNSGSTRCTTNSDCGSGKICQSTPYGKWCINATSSTCGNGSCDINETVATCSKDCATASGVTDCSSSTSCGEGLICENKICKPSPILGVAACGNNICDYGESQAICPKDCGSGGLQACTSDSCPTGYVCGTAGSSLGKCVLPEVQTGENSTYGGEACRARTQAQCAGACKWDPSGVCILAGEGPSYGNIAECPNNGDAKMHLCPNSLGGPCNRSDAQTITNPGMVPDAGRYGAKVSYCGVVQIDCIGTGPGNASPNEDLVFSSQVFTSGENCKGTGGVAPKYTCVNNECVAVMQSTATSYSSMAMCLTSCKPAPQTVTQTDTPNNPPPVEPPPGYFCGSSCESNEQCQTADSRFSCSNNKCVLASNPTNENCQNPTGPMCLSISLANLSDPSAPATQDPKIGQSVQFTCGEVANISKYAFRVIEPGGSITNLTATGRVSAPYTLVSTGTFFAQCQICTGQDDASCLPYENPVN